MTGPSAGLEFRQAHFPGQAPIDAYGNGGFRFAEMSHRGSLICLPSGIYAWDVETPEELVAENFEKIFEESKAVEILLVGSGLSLVPIPAKLRDRLRANGISGDAMPTGSAVRTYNVLVSENRAVAAALLAVE